MALISGIWRSFYTNLPIDIFKKQDKLTSQKKRSNADNNKAFTSSEPPTSLFVPLPTIDLFIKFMKMFMKMTQA